MSRWVASWPVPFTPALAVERIAAIREAMAQGRELCCAVERRDGGALLGLVGVSRTGSDPRRGSLGYWLGEAHHGQGYMREAAPVVVEAAFERLGLEVIEAGAQPGNAASFAVIRACGMWSTGERDMFAPARGRHERCVFHEVTRPRG